MYPAASAGAVSTSPAPTGKPASASTPAIAARVRDVVLVSSAILSPAARIRDTAATAPGSGRHDTVSTPSMSIRTASMAGSYPIPAGPAPAAAIMRYRARASRRRRLARCGGALIGRMLQVTGPGDRNRGGNGGHTGDHAARRG